MSDSDKDQFHCNGCGFCRVGGRDNFIHCTKCDICVNKEVFDTHKCVNIKYDRCPICMDELYMSITSVIQMKCGHYLHHKCMIDLLNSSYKCPLCLASIVDTDNYNKLIDQEIERIELPEEYRNMRVDILCNDCHKQNNVSFHIVGLKCPDCGSYNTRKI